MSEKPVTEDGYSADDLQDVRRICLYVATKLGDLLPEIVVVGGLVPSLLIDKNQIENNYSNAFSSHVGTRDLDLGLSLGLFEKSKYKKISKRLRSAGFSNEVKPSGEKRTHRWLLEKSDMNAELDFLIGQTKSGKDGGEIKNLEKDFSAIVTPGLGLAFEDQEKVEIKENIPEAGSAKRKINVCGPAAFIVLKSLVFNLRGENKDAYDLYYVLSNFEGGVQAIAQRFSELNDDSEIQKSIDILRNDFSKEDRLGPQSVANFVASEPEEETKADVVAFIDKFLKNI